jgi:putative Mn2+ efflux pump MntP
MEKTGGSNGEPSIEGEFARTFKLIDLYFRQKTDLFIQNYVIELFEYMERQVMFLSVIVTLLAVASASLYVGVVLLFTLYVPIWAALLITSVLTFILAGIGAYVLFSRKLILNTPTASELMGHAKA